MDLLDRLRLDVPVAQAGMGGGLAGPELAGVVAAAGGLGTLGLSPSADLRKAIRQVRDAAPDRSVAVNLLMPFVRRILAADKTFRTKLFGLGWNAPHRVVANAATRRWCRDDGRAKVVPRTVNACSGVFAKLPDRAALSLLRMQSPGLPAFSPCPHNRDARFGSGAHRALRRRDGAAHDIRHIGAPGSD